MNAEMRALAERAVRCKVWRWLPGMQAMPLEVFPGAHIPARRCFGGDFWVADGSREVRHHHAGDLLPDLTDPATLGCLLALVREAWGDPEAYTRTQPRGGATVWVVYVLDKGAQISRGPAMAEGSGSMLYGPTQAHALVAALEAAP